ncbi:lamin tail domain-containing protein [candidate division WOR-3 bacterium]|nr:lamin tail domain-containing protein [candidate division WOR-3 bacterium]
MSPLLLVLLSASRVIVTEVMANPLGGTGARFPEDRNEYVELHNPGPHAVDLFNWTLDDGDATDRLIAWQDTSLLAVNPTLVIGSTWLRPGGYAVVLDSEYTCPNPEGDQVLPYVFGDSALVLTTPNTTIGNGLAVNDPLTVFSPYGDTTNFGTPADPGDDFPANPGDGLSWERIDPLGPDSAGNWAVCLDTNGTPGRPNSITRQPDLAVTQLEPEQPDSLVPGEAFHCLVTVANPGFVATREWRLRVFLDRNGSSLPEPEQEPVQTLLGWNLLPGADSSLRLRFTCPRVRTELWARLECPDDRDTLSNIRRYQLQPGAEDRFVSLSRPGFSPDGDGFEDSLEIVLSLPEPGRRLELVIFDLGGHAVRRLYSDKPGEEHGLIGWDGRDDSGRELAAGIYALWARYDLVGRALEARLPVALYR